MSTYTFGTRSTVLKPGNAISFTNNDFRGADVLINKRPILPIRIELNFDTSDLFYIYTVHIGHNIFIGAKTNAIPGQGIAGSSYSTLSYTGVPVNVVNYTSFAANGVTPPSDKTTFRFFAQLDHPANTGECEYKTGDKYFFNTEAETGNMIVVFQREKEFNEETACFNSFFKNLSLTMTVPKITINFQSLIDGSDIGNTNFKILDEFQYYNMTTPIIPDYICKVNETNNSLVTVFDESCPIIVSVLRGIGNTSYQKIEYLFNTEQINTDDFYNFMILIIKYSMTRYLLAKIMYGRFNIKYIKNKYTKRFIKDLGNTRFCNFVYFFNDPNSDVYGYDQYFI